MTTYYVRQDGLDGNAGTSDDAAGAWHSIQYGFDRLAAGDVLQLQSATWRAESKAAGADGRFVAAATFGSATAAFVTAGVAAGDYVFVTDPDGTFRSYRIQSVDSQTQLTLAEAASAADPSTNRPFWVCAPDRMPVRTLSYAREVPYGGSVVQVRLNGAVLDGADQVWTVMTLGGGDYRRVRVMGPGRMCGGTASGILFEPEYHYDDYLVSVEGVEVCGCPIGIEVGYFCQNVTILGCRVHGCQTGIACNANPSSQARLVGNAIDDNQVGVLAARVELLGNLICSNVTAGVRVMSVYDDAYMNNVIWGNGYGIWFGADLAEPQAAPVLAGNIVWGNATADLYNEDAVHALGYISRNNCVGVLSGLGLYRDATDVADDPRFVDAAGGDFRLRGASPCLAAGFVNPHVAGAVMPMGLSAARRYVPGRAAVYANVRQAVAR
ncbi:MAG: hypothetical protein GXY33_13735 [Phycisphaerae bacterium]|nr:hypothetical protein [Phycisphaerae bacterium]